ncbi:MAG: hypothetical protein P0S96_07895 [Simkaniaceae bacterium]|nr:hypothetical protein [Candidatus Sacchlamyda saccharinae]
MAAVSGFFQRHSDVILEGSFWGSWCGLNILNWTVARSELQKAQALPESTGKADKVWLANKKYILSSFSFVSGLSMVTSFFQEVGVISLGALAPLAGGLGFGGSAVVSSSKLWDNLRKFDEGIVAFNKTNSPREKAQIALDQLQTLVEISFYVTVVAWGVLGAAHALLGGTALFLAMDTALYYAVLCFAAYAISSISIPILKQAT